MRLLQKPARCALRMLLFLVAATTSIAQTTAPPTRLQIPRVSRPPILDDFLSMQPSVETVAGMAKVEGFIQREPEDGKPVSQRTEAYVGWDEKNLYVVFICFDEHPNLIREIGRASCRERV